MSETASAFIEKNTIGNNVKANVALGGDNSVNSIIYDNDIFGSVCEGIFSVNGGYTWIWKNRIHDNLDGIVLADSCPYILENQMNSNQRSGMILTGQSYPNVLRNTFNDNYTCGILFKENSYGIFENNVVFE